MSADDGSRPSVRLPERLDRSARLGPFPSGGGAVRFLVLGGVGAILALAWGPLVWLPFLGGGLFLGVYRFEGEPVDERVLSYARWRWRRFRPSEGPTARTPGGLPGEVRLPSGDWCAGFAAGGMPVAFLPAPAAERVFRLYRDLLRGCELSVSYRIDRAPLRLRRLPTGKPPADARVLAAREGYRELLQLLIRRRRRRWVLVRLTAPGDLAGLRRLQGQLRSFEDFFATLEVPFRRLRGREIDPACSTVPAAGRGA